MGTPDTTLAHELAEARRQLAALRDVATAVGGTLELTPLLQAIIQAVCTVVDCERASLFVVDDATGDLVSRVLTGHDTEIRLRPGQGIAGAVVASQTPIRLDDAHADERFHRDVDAATGYRTRTLLAVPIRDRDGVIRGVVEALNKRNGPFDVDDEQLLQALGAELVVALHRARLFDELQRQKAEALRRVEELDLLVDIDRALFEADGVQALLDVVVERTRRVLPSEAASVALLDVRTSALVYRAVAGRGQDRILARAVPTDTGLAGIAFRDKVPVRVEDASTDPRHALHPSKLTSLVPGPLLVLPLLVPHAAEGQEGDRVLGVLTALRQRGAPSFTDADERLLQLIANRVAFAVAEEERKERARAKAQLENMGHMLAGIVHDFKTPMTVISGYVQLMATEEDAAERQKTAALVMKATEQMTTMIKELLAFARGDSTVLLRKVWIEALMRDAEEVLRRVVGTGRVVLDIDVETRAAVRADDLKLKRALANLVKNAREALEQHPPAAPHVPRIHVRVGDDGDDVVFVVTDNGPGLPREMETRLFREFATFGKEGGTGLGLALVKRIAEEHHGSIHVENRPGAGCTFTLRIPRS